MDAVTLQFVNTTATPICELLRAAKPRIDDAMVTWFNGINGNVPDDGTILNTGRTRDGLLRLNGSDIRAAMSQISAIQTMLNEPGVMAVITRLTSHPLGAQ